MAISTTTIRKAAGWARTDVIYQLEEAFTWLGWHGETQTGIITSISDYSGGGTVTSQIGIGDYRYYNDVPVSTTSGIGTGASFGVIRYNGAINGVYVNRPGVGYTNGEYITLSPSDTGGTGATAIGVTVSVLGGASPTGVGSTTTFYDKDVTAGASYPWGVMRHVIQPNKKYGTTYRGFQVFSNSLYTATGSSFFPYDTSNIINKGGGYSNRFAGEDDLDLYTTSSFVPTTTDNQYTTSATLSYNQFSATYASSTSYQLDLNIFRSGIDPNFAVLSFRQPTLSSTHLVGNTYLTFIVHNFTTSIWDLDNLFLGGTTRITPDSSDSSNPYITFTTYLDGSNGAKRCAEWGYSRTYTSKSTKYFSTVYPTSSDAGQRENPTFYYRENTTITGRGTGGTGNNPVYLSSNTNYNAVIKGIPLSSQILPVPYYIPDDFVLIDFDYATPLANIQQGDTVTISGSEVYTVITGSYNQTTRTRGVLFCARTV